MRLEMSMDYYTQCQLLFVTPLTDGKGQKDVTVLMANWPNYPANELKHQVA